MNSLQKPVSSFPSIHVQVFPFQNQRLQPSEGSYCWHLWTQQGKEIKICWAPTLCWRLTDMILFNSNNHAGRNFTSVSIFQMRRLRLTELVGRSGPCSACCPSPCTFHHSTASHGVSRGLSGDIVGVSRMGRSWQHPPWRLLMLLQAVTLREAGSLSQNPHDTWVRALASNPYHQPNNSKDGGMRGSFQVSCPTF